MLSSEPQCPFVRHTLAMPTTNFSFFCSFSETTIDTYCIPSYKYDDDGRLNSDGYTSCYRLHIIWQEILAEAEHKVSASNINLSKSLNALDLIKTMEEKYTFVLVPPLGNDSRLPTHVCSIHRKICLDRNMVQKSESAFSPRLLSH